MNCWIYVFEMMVCSASAQDLFPLRIPACSPNLDYKCRVRPFIQVPWVMLGGEMLCLTEVYLFYRVRGSNQQPSDHRARLIISQIVK